MRQFEAYVCLIVIPLFCVFTVQTGDESPTVPPPVATVTVQIPVNVTTVQEKHNLLAVYISVPVLIGVIIIAAVVILYYRK